MEAEEEEEEEEEAIDLFEGGGKDRDRDRYKPGEKLDVHRLELLLKQRVKSQNFCVSQLHDIVVLVCFDMCVATISCTRKYKIDAKYIPVLQLLSIV